MPRSMRGHWIDNEWPSGAVKLDLNVLDYELWGIEAGIPAVEAIPLLIGDAIQEIEPAILGDHPAYLVTLGDMEDSTLPDQLHVLELEPGKLLVIVVYPRLALQSADVQMILASLVLSPEQEVQLPGLPPAAPVDGRQLFFDDRQGVCFSYPAGSKMVADDLTWNLSGPERTDGRAILTVDTERISAASTLSQIVDAYVSESSGADTVSRQPSMLDREAAELLDWGPGREYSLEIFAIHGDQLYHLVFSPSPEDSPEAGQDMNDLFLAVATTWTFLPSSEGASASDRTLAIPEASMAIRLPAGSMLVKNSELFRRGSFASYDFAQPTMGDYPYLAEIQFFSHESIREFSDRCSGAEYPCFFGDYPDVERYDGQQEALSLAQDYQDSESTQFNGRSFLVSNHNCEGVPCVVREYTTFIRDTKVDTWVMMADESQEQQADALFAGLGFQDDLSKVQIIPGPLQVLTEPGLTLHSPLGWEIRQETDSPGSSVAHSISFIPPTCAASDQPQVPAINLFVYDLKLVGSLQEWLDGQSTPDPFGSPAGSEIHFFGVKDAVDFRAASVLGLTFTYDLFGLPAHQILFSVGQTVVGLSYVDMGSVDLEPAFDQMLSSLTLATSPAPAQTDVNYIVALTDLAMYRGPDTKQQIGGIADGQVALVTGTSQDGQWWRVICPNDTIGDCWVSAEPQLSQPTAAPQR